MIARLWRVRVSYRVMVVARDEVAAATVAAREGWKDVSVDAVREAREVRRLDDVPGFLRDCVPHWDRGLAGADDCLDCAAVLERLEAARRPEDLPGQGRMFE